MKPIIFSHHVSPGTLQLCNSSQVSVNSVTLISKKDIARIVKILLKVNLQAASYSLQPYQEETFSAHFFLEVLRVTVLLSKCFKKNITI